MSDFPDVPRFEPGDGEGEGSDPDTSLILDYLSNKLDPEDAQRLEERARGDKDFRYKLADIVLLKGLVMLALEKDPGPEGRECRRTQRLFLDYLKGRTNAKKTALLSRHLEQCFECELAFERFQQHPEQVAPTLGGQRLSGIWQRLKRTRSVAVAAIVVVALAAGAVGVVGILGSAGTPGRAVPSATVADAGGAAQGFLLDRKDVLSALDNLVASDPTIDRGQKLSGLVEDIASVTAVERAQLYPKLEEFGSTIERLLWRLFANEPDLQGRTQILMVIQKAGVGDRAALMAAIRREAAAPSEVMPLLVAAVLANPDDAGRELLANIVREHPLNPPWIIKLFYQLYASPMKDHAVVQERMQSMIADRNDGIRSWAVLAAANYGDATALSMAVDLFASPDADARDRAALAVARQGSAEARKQLANQKWLRTSVMRDAIINFLRKSGTELPQDF